MPAYLVCVGLRQREEDRAAAAERLSERIRNRFKTHLQRFESVWVLHTEMTASQIRHYLRPCIGPDDRLLVVRSGHQAAWAGFERDESVWLKDHL